MAFIIYNSNCFEMQAMNCSCGDPQGKIYQTCSHLQYILNQMAALSAAAGNAFTTVFAGLALTMHTLPNISLLPALVAGFTRVLILHRPAMLKAPFFLTSAVTASARPAMYSRTIFGFTSHLVATAAINAPLLMAAFPFMAFFMGGSIATGRSGGATKNEPH